MFHPPRHATLIKPLATTAFAPRKEGDPAPKRTRYRDPLKTKAAKKHQKAFLRHLKKMSNDYVFRVAITEHYEMAHYDGYQSPLEVWEGEALARELVLRLKKSGFLKA